MLEQITSYDVNFVSANNLTSKDYDVATEIIEYLIDTNVLDGCPKGNIAHMLSFDPFMSGLNSFVFTHNNVKYLAVPNMHRTGPTQSSLSVSVSVEAIN